MMELYKLGDEIANEAIYGNKDSSNHGIVLYALVCCLRAKNVLELGTRYGDTSLPILYGLYKTKGKLISVDISTRQIKTNKIPQELQGHWTIIEQDAISFLETTQIKQDIIYVDDWHGSEHVYKELTLIKKLLHERSVVVLHDMMHSHSDPVYNNTSYPIGNEFEGNGPYGGLKKFAEENPEFEFATIPINHGLTILRKIQ